MVTDLRARHLWRTMKEVGLLNEDWSVGGVLS